MFCRTGQFKSLFNADDFIERVSDRSKHITRRMGHAVVADGDGELSIRIGPRNGTARAGMMKGPWITPDETIRVVVSKFAAQPIARRADLYREAENRVG